MQSTSSTAIQQKIKKWKEALSDLSKRNRLLYFKKDKLATIELSCLAEDLYDKLVIVRKGIPISSLQTVHTEIELLKRLKKLRQIANSTLEEKGINSLFVAVGMLHWNSGSDKSQDSFASPILLVPASLCKEYKKEEYILNPLNEDMFINPILVQKLRDDFGVFLPADDGLQEMTSTQILEEIQQAVATHTDWQVEATTFIGLFSYAKAVMIRDLTEYEDLIAAHPVLRALAGDLSGYDSLPIKSPSSGELDSKVDPQLVFQVLEADSSQQEVIEAAKAGLNFVVQGPLNRKGGERRLNVAVTRAKNKLILVSSLRSSDLDLGRTSSRAVALLKDYLAYAASNGKQLEGNRYDGELRFDSPFEEDVYLALRDRGYTVRSQIGCSTYRIDLGVVDDTRPGEFLLGVECDGATYHSSPTARDRDRLRQKVLEGLGWKFHRIWSREWFRDKPGQMTKLVNRIEFLKAQGRS
jgi:very-short-patch-repair endonuclease